MKGVPVKITSKGKRSNQVMVDYMTFRPKHVEYLDRMMKQAARIYDIYTIETLEGVVIARLGSEPI